MNREQNDAFAASIHAGVAQGMLQESERYARLADAAVDPAFAVAMTNMSGSKMLGCRRRSSTH
jgi:hypothetical protein